jgi:hypothetical protein
MTNAEHDASLALLNVGDEIRVSPASQSAKDVSRASSTSQSVRDVSAKTGTGLLLALPRASHHHQSINRSIKSNLLSPSSSSFCLRSSNTNPTPSLINSSNPPLPSTPAHQPARSWKGHDGNNENNDGDVDADVRSRSRSTPSHQHQDRPDADADTNAQADLLKPVGSYSLLLDLRN